jgi:hypothetical protein
MGGAGGPRITRLAAPRRALSLLAVVVAASFLCGCDQISAFFREQSPPEVPPIPPATSVDRGSKSASPPADAGAGARRPPVLLDPKTRRAMRLAPMSTPSPRIAFGKGRLAVLDDDALVVRDTREFAEVVRLPLPHAHSVTALYDGSFFAEGASGGLRLLPHDGKARPVPRLPFLPSSTLLPDRRSADRVWVLPGRGGALFAYDLAAERSFLSPEAWVELDGYDHRAFGSLRDGSFLYTSGSGLQQFYGPKKKDAVEGDVRGAFRLLPASRPDTVWVLAEQKARLCRLLGGKLVRLLSVDLETSPYVADADGEYLAVLELAQTTDVPWRFVLEVFDVRGKRRLRTELPAEESLEADWLSRLTRDRGLAVWADPPLVAVGGPGAVSVWAADTGKPVLPVP